jgi:hypothetical protein
VRSNTKSIDTHHWVSSGERFFKSNLSKLWRCLKSGYRAFDEDFDCRLYGLTQNLLKKIIWGDVNGECCTQAEA